MNLSTEEKAELIDAAWAAIRSRFGLGGNPKQKLASLGEPGASFVTLHSREELRGCIGSLDPDRPLFLDVTRNAEAAAFHDPRFSPVTREELTDLTLSVSVLSSFEEVPFSTEEELIGQLTPGVSGLVLFQGDRRATFLPSVWEVLPDPGQFVRRLKHKAGLPDEPVANLHALRYTTTSFS